jgi:ssDNA-binding Zn-finger/Zn-ribbon topoisomerase 1
MRARFYCAHCSAEVNPKAERCPSCGKFFSAVTCPSCGFEGDVDTFLKGCPVCGYLVQTEKKRKPAAVEGPVVRESAEERGHFSRAFYRIVLTILAAALVVLVVLLLFLNK